jgi:hypothetical protein
MQALLKDALEGRFAIILAESLDRLSCVCGHWAFLRRFSNRDLS